MSENAPDFRFSHCCDPSGKPVNSEDGTTLVVAPFDYEKTEERIEQLISSLPIKKAYIQRMDAYWWNIQYSSGRNNEEDAGHLNLTYAKQPVIFYAALVILGGLLGAIALISWD